MSEGGNGRAWSAEIKDLGEKIVTLTVAKAKELGDYLEEVHGIKPAGGGGGVMVQAPTDKAVAPVAEVKTEFTVTLDGYDAAKKINVIKVVREITGLGLKDAKDLVEAHPKPVKENIPKEEADKILKMLTEGGAKASIK